MEARTGGGAHVVVDGSARLPIGSPPAPVPPGKQQRQLQIGESADMRWRAELDGKTLARSRMGGSRCLHFPQTAGT